jgi:hypothetical protein
MIHFRLIYSVRDLRLAHSDVVTVELGGPHGVSVVVRAAKSDEYGRAKGHGLGFCIASASAEPSEQIRQVFSDIAADRILEESADPARVRMEYTAPDGTHVRLPDPADISAPLESFLGQMQSELSSSARRVIGILRWRTNRRGPHNPVASRGFYWSFDGEGWHPAPDALSTTLQVHQYSPIARSVHEEISNLFTRGEQEPLYHNLFREAREQRSSNPRSAVIIAMAAAELAVKQCVAVLVPHATWLAINLPSPPIVRMLTEYLPQLPARCTIDGRVKAPPKPLLDQLRKGVNIRNGLAHAGAETPKPRTVDELLVAVSDLIWLIDYYCGYEWALDYVSSETRSQLTAA